MKRITTLIRLSENIMGQASQINEENDVIYMQILCYKVEEKYWLEKDKITCQFRELSHLPKKIKGLIHTRVYRSLRHDSDFIIWMSSKNPENIRDAMELIYATVGYSVKSTFSMLSIYVKSQYLKNASNIENDLQKEGFRYFVGYPMSKAPEWYLLDYETRKKIMDEHIRTAMSHPMNQGIRSYTTYSFSIADQEFAVLYEVDSLYRWMKVAESLREVQARKWIVKEEPVLTGIILE
ncbi:MAG: chlorite dismutase family protein [Thermoplasmataceae archaeon]